jgi:hypothetical protein
LTYGEFLRACRMIAARNLYIETEKKNKGAESGDLLQAAETLTKSDFSRMLGLLDPDHYIGAENDKPGKVPSRELLEAAAKVAGLNFQDCIQIPKEHAQQPDREQQKLIRMLLDILNSGGNGAEWIRGNILTFHETHVRGRRRGAVVTESKKRPKR